MDDIFKKCKQAYVTTFYDGLAVPWKPLPISDYILFTHKYHSGYLVAEIENRIFKQCCLDDSILRRFDYLKAGVVSTVVTNIWTYSGPQGAEGLAQDLNMARAFNKSPLTSSLSEIAKMISLAFPYKPEEIYAMPYEDFIIRAAQAEDKLLALGMMTEPLIVHTEQAEEKPVPKKPRVDAKQLWEIQQGLIEKDKQRANPAGLGKDLPASESPVLKHGAKHNLNFARERRGTESAASMSGWDKEELPIKRAKMVEDARIIYKDLIEKLEQKHK